MAVKKPKFNPLTSWSYSTYTQYIKCPFSVCLDKIQRVRIVEPPNANLERGNAVHAGADMAVSDSKFKIKDLMPELVRVKPVIEKLRKAKAKVEQLWAFTREWEPCNWKDWDRAWLRVKTDVCMDTVTPPHVDIIDWKTGRVHEEHKRQRTLYALAGLQLVKLGQLAGGSKNTKLEAQHIYVDTGQTATEVFLFKNLESLRKQWEARTEIMFKDTTFNATPGPHCRWCKFAKSKGGPCPENQ